MINQYHIAREDNDLTSMENSAGLKRSKSITGPMGGGLATGRLLKTIPAPIGCSSVRR